MLKWEKLQADKHKNDTKKISYCGLFLLLVYLEFRSRKPRNSDLKRHSNLRSFYKSLTILSPIGITGKTAAIFEKYSCSNNLMLS